MITIQLTMTLAIRLQLFISVETDKMGLFFFSPAANGDSQGSFTIVSLEDGGTLQQQIARQVLRKSCHSISKSCLTSAYESGGGKRPGGRRRNSYDISK